MGFQPPPLFTVSIKFQGVDPRPPGPRVPAVEVEALPNDTESLLRIWRPHAVLRAEKGDSEFAIARFLVAKGVNREAAKLAAGEIVKNPVAVHATGAGLAKVAGIILLMLGLVVPVACFVFGLGGFVFAAAMLGSLAVIGAACKLLWPG